MTLKTWTIERGHTEGEQIEEMAALLEREQILILPTDTIYGLHGLATSPSAVETIRAAKRRRDDQPFVVLCSDIDQLPLLGVTAPSDVLEALAKIWPAPLTAILPLAQPVPASAGRSSIGVRIPDLEWLRHLVRRTGPLASTSTNLSGEPAATRTVDIPDELLKQVAGIADAGTLEGQPSTLVQFTETSPRILREGHFRFTQKLWKTVWKSL